MSGVSAASDVRDVAVLGGGAWGTALAVHLAQHTHARPRVALFMRSDEQLRDCLATRTNRRYLPDVRLADSIVLTSSLGDIRGADLLFAATPVAELLPLVAALEAAGVNAPLVSLAKGFVAAGGGWSLPHRALAAAWPHSVATVTGPTFAEEVARGLPTALVVAATDAALTTRVAALLRGETLRAYASDDLPGIEVGGAIKNVFAIAAGASDGLRFGDNARAALITRGLSEAGRLSAALGGRRETLTGLAGLGDLVLTCTGNLSRNRRVGLALGSGQPLAHILSSIGHVAEGVIAARAARDLARQFALDMPIVEAVHRVLFENVEPRDAVLALLAREPRAE
jgi:glycerol-3-phosphate dehydrogenase (NAD(P)+)